MSPFLDYFLHAGSIGTHEGIQFSNETRMSLDANVCQKVKGIIYRLIDEAHFC